MPVPVAQLEQIALGTCPKRNDLHEFFLPEKLEALSANGVQCQLGVINTRCGEAAADKDEELFDIVDEENNVVGQERRKRGPCSGHQTPGGVLLRVQQSRAAVAPATLSKVSELHDTTKIMCITSRRAGGFPYALLAGSMLSSACASVSCVA